jgi:hypothetical protein
MKRTKFYRKLTVVCFLAVLCLISADIHADEASRIQFDGEWTGTILVDGVESVIEVKIVIRGNRITQYFGNYGEWESVEPDNDYYLYERNNLVYVWANSGGVWSETQVFSLSLINESTLDIIWLRHVNNYRNGTDNELWSLSGFGELSKVAAKENVPQ